MAIRVTGDGSWRGTHIDSDTPIKYVGFKYEIRVGDEKGKATLLLEHGEESVEDLVLLVINAENYEIVSDGTPRNTKIFIKEGSNMQQLLGVQEMNFIIMPDLPPKLYFEIIMMPNKIRLPQ